MYRAPTKRRQLTQRVIVYAAMTVGVATLVTFLVLVMLGYRFNRATSTIQQGGLVQFDTRPTDAKVRIGTADLTDTTPSKITVNPGSYNVIMQKDGYLPWNKKVSIIAGKVLWLNYTQLIPETIERTKVASFAAVAQNMTSPNSQYMAVLPNKTQPALTIVRVNGSKIEQAKITIENATASTTYRIKEWSDDSNRLLVSATNAGVTRWLLVKRDAKVAGDVIDLSARYGASLKKVEFDPRGNDRLIVVTDENDLRLLNLGNDALSSIIVSDVKSYSTYGNSHLLYVSDIDKATESLGYVSYSDINAPRELKRIKTTMPVKVAGASYFGEPHIAISIGSNVEVYKMNDLPPSVSQAPISLETVAERTIPGVPTHLSIRANGRFVVMQYAGGFATYDIELDRQTLTSSKAVGSSELRWFDRYHPYVADGKQLVVMEFDGSNQHEITKTSGLYDALQTDNGQYIYTVHDTKNGVELRRNKIITD